MNIQNGKHKYLKYAASLRVKVFQYRNEHALYWKYDEWYNLQAVVTFKTYRMLLCHKSFFMIRVFMISFFCIVFNLTFDQFINFFQREKYAKEYIAFAVINITTNNVSP